VFGLYKGIGSPMMGLTFVHGIVFGVQGNAMHLLGEDTPMHQLITGAGAVRHLLPHGARVSRASTEEWSPRSSVKRLPSRVFLGSEPSDSYMIPKLLFSGGMACHIASWIVNYPVDVINSHLRHRQSGADVRPW
ncbi:hypothetical protein CCH79_00000127, partial [Gambusia affinis]